MNEKNKPETEVLELVISTLKVIRDPRRKGHRIELAAPAAELEMELAARLQKLAPKPKTQKSFAE